MKDHVDGFPLQGAGSAVNSQDIYIPQAATVITTSVHVVECRR